MRFPKDEQEAARQVAYAIDQGVNYFDTAYIYSGNEAVLGRILAKDGYRDRVKIATKIPPYIVRKYEDLEKIFRTQLTRLQTDHIDYYFIHMLTDVKIWDRLKDLGILQWLEEKRRAGQIVNTGFSYHGGRDAFVQLVDAHDWDFCMIQYNFLDENNQAGKSGLQYAAAKGMPVMIMEPLRGGKLISALPKEVYALWENAHVKRTPAEWALRWVWDHPEATVVLSGMNTQAMLEENIRIASEVEAHSFTDPDYALFEQVRELLRKAIQIPCTGCGYCLPCPKGVDIPSCFSSYNDIAIVGKARAVKNYLMQTGMRPGSAAAAQCVQCGQCETHCPQSIPIRDSLKMTSRALEGFYFKPLQVLLRKFMRF
jgi:predicted aldo/keto reductase-like oxidoreductase